MKKYLSTAALVIFAITGKIANAATATSQMGDQNSAFLKVAGLAVDTSIAGIIAVIIKTLLGLLAVIFVVLLVYAGFQWMTAEGNESKVETAKATITRATIGLVIIIASYAITYFIFNMINGAASGGVHSGG